MMRYLLPCLLLAACNSGTGPSDEAKQPAAAETPAPTAAGADSALTGLYEGMAGEQTNQLCMIGKGDKQASFGLVVWGGNLHSCSGTGTATLDGGTLRLAMAGDSECAIDATMKDGAIALPEDVPEGCAYYCGARARLSGATFARKAATRAAALEAKDLVGEPLCQGM